MMFNMPGFSAKQTAGTASDHAGDDLRWSAVQQRDAASDGRFVYAVATTGVFCRPSCGARRPLRRNVRFYATAQQAQAAGFRACLRCKPGEPAHPQPGEQVALEQVPAEQAPLEPATAEQAIAEACRYLEAHLENPPRYEHLARRAGMGGAHFHRLFKRMVGVTPKRFVDALRMKHFKAGLRSGGTVTEGIYSSGFSSSSRLYDRAEAGLGMLPTQYRKGAAGLDISHITLDSPLGLMLLAATDRGICFLQFGSSGQALLHMLETEFPKATRRPASTGHPDFGLWIKAIQVYLNGASQLRALPLDLHATAFQTRVWDYLQTIPAGKSRSYSQVAADLDAPGATRAVASACARNRVALLVPCHRVLRSNGDLGGYKWGLHRKQALLDLERAPSDAASSCESATNPRRTSGGTSRQVGTQAIAPRIASSTGRS